MKLKCIIIDDEPVARKLLREFIEEIDLPVACSRSRKPFEDYAVAERQ